MSKTARKKSCNQAPSRSEQRTLRLAAIVRRNLYEFVIREGMKALDEMLEQDRERLCGPSHTKGAPEDPVRWGQTQGRLVMGGQRVAVRKPRVRKQGKEVELPTWAEFADEDPLDERAFEQMVVGVSTRKYKRSVEPLPEELAPHAASKSAVSRKFVGMTTRKVDEWLNRDLAELRIAAVMLDGIAVGDHIVIAALGIDEVGRKHPLGLWLGATENHGVCGQLLDHLVERGLDPQRAYLFVIDGSKALRKAIKDRFGRRALVHRCQEHKRRNVLRHLPKKLHGMVSKTMRDAYKSKSKATAKRRLLQLVAHLADEHPDAAESLKEGLDETLTLKDMNLSASLERTLSTTNPIENLNGIIREVSRRVKRWRDGKMVKRWVAAGVLEAQRGFRRLRGHKSMPTLIAALAQHAEQIDRIDHEQAEAA
jgi:transposase-like protein